MIALNMRDRRCDEAKGVVWAACGRALRESVAVHARSALCSRRTRAILDMSTCDPEEIWALVSGVATRLPHDPRLTVEVRLPPALGATATLRPWPATRRGVARRPLYKDA